ncbi:acyl-CoA carboxylase subunit epsilon [Streptomyces sp. Tu 3180]|uniref:acyl-CoA carboxylase subunit epsilon n=1 Tax=Streptomyces sp. Tu 3180 TaxID=2682611 RepID=UPI00135C677C|nr:acyl-CoA carboxylase subunit epsilon [Streptomyces sp. Tu 3180]KAF3463163.1 acyl-CoA carboxylase subunit epsilon [Streptomyces sp. Tu 3180]KAF3469354.1 acyl-CoA carboxylase subunit epsilon [Streptomyces sp. Tu 3180]
MDSPHAVLRVERGRATREELAAVTAVLVSLLAAREADTGSGPAPGSAPWRPERAAEAYRSPYNWQ